VCGLVNPFGPTLTAVVAAGELRSGAEVPLIRVMLNPFSQELQAVGELTVGHTWSPVFVIRSLFGVSFGSCPSLLLPSRHLKAEESLSVHAAFLRGFGEAREVLEKVRQYFGNPWKRVGEEVSGMNDPLLRKFLVVTEKAPTPLDEAGGRELVSLLLSDRHTREEIRAFLYAWDGSIKFQREQGSPAMADAAMNMEVFSAVFGRIAESCRVPDFGGA